ncbi:LPXTG cell wall anchor domain-containing protein [Streptomyces sp. PR69]|uniref:LPXTG cell wall anchor domain-containing protein n=1 Tax=Streptomyces sp. PR69 TaxID=2984950 RepID=UPI002263E8A5|nr:LPXTG cell wall anchor domain-containing protein [Streptomyces sp. PR69]
MPTFRNRWATAAVPAAASLLLVAGGAPAFAADGDGLYSPTLRQQLPRTATTQDDGAPQENDCADIPADMDGWHFVLPGNKADFVKLTVTFEPGGQQVITDFGPPSGMHAYVASQPGATLVSVVAEVKGGGLEKFNLSHTCPAGAEPVKPEPDDTPDGDETQTTEPSPSRTSSETTDGKPSATPSKTASETTSETASETGKPSATPSPDASSPAASMPAEEGGRGAGDLAETGSSTPVLALSAVAAALVAGGGFLVLRRRRAASQN